MRILKTIIWRIVFFFIAIIGPHRITFGKDNLLILTYHRVLPSADERINFEQPGMYVSEASFDMQMRLLRKYFTVMPLHEWLVKAKNNEPLPKRTCAVTFDDGWQDNYAYAYPILKKYQIPATIFVVSSFVGSEKDFWPGRLAQLLFSVAKTGNQSLFRHVSWLNKSKLSYQFNNVSPSVDELDEIIMQCKQNSDSENHAYIDQAWQALAEEDSNLQEVNYRATLNQPELEEMLASGLVKMGSHTCNHIRMLDTLAIDTMQHEVGESKKQLESQFDASVELFCYPNGDVSSAAFDQVKQDYLGACTTVRGWNSSGSHLHLLKRVSMHDSMTATRNAFLAKISGWI